MADLTALLGFLDVKTKEPGGSGGFSDGNAICVRGTIPSSGSFEFGPPPGKAWTLMAMGQSELAAQSALLFNFDATDAADVSEFFVLGDGTEIPLEESTVPPESPFESIEGLAEGVVFAYPNKIRIRRTNGGSFPQGRVLHKSFWLEHDLPKDQV